MGLLTVWWERYHQGTHEPLFAISPPRASSHCQPSYLVLSGQTILAIEPYFHLSAMDSRTDAPAWSMHVLAALAGLCAAIYLRKKVSGTQPRSRRRYFL